MPCDTRPTLTQLQRQAQDEALKRLQAALGAGAITLTIGRQGALAITGWAEDQREGLSDVCAFRRLANTPELRRALAAAEARAGVRLDRRMITQGVHSHDGGKSWHGGH